MISPEGGITGEEPDFFTHKWPDNTVIEIYVVGQDELSSPLKDGDTVMFSYTSDELNRLGSGNVNTGASRVMHELEVGNETLEQILEGGNRPLEDELDLLPPLFPIPEPRPN